MIWTQMVIITALSLVVSVSLSQVFNVVAPKGMPFTLTFGTTTQLSMVFLIIGFIGATLSGLQIKKIEPLQAIQQGEALIMTLFTIDAVRKTFKNGEVEEEILKGINLSLKEGEITALVAPLVQGKVHC